MSQKWLSPFLEVPFWPLFSTTTLFRHVIYILKWAILVMYRFLGLFLGHFLGTFRYAKCTWAFYPELCHFWQYTHFWGYPKMRFFGDFSCLFLVLFNLVGFNPRVSQKGVKIGVPKIAHFWPFWPIFGPFFDPFLPLVGNGHYYMGVLRGYMLFMSTYWNMGSQKGPILGLAAPGGGPPGWPPGVIFGDMSNCQFWRFLTFFDTF